MPVKGEIAGVIKTLILGLGNSGFADERMGLDVARGLHALLKDPDIDIIETPASGIDLLGVVAGYRKVVIVDCVQGDDWDIGELRRLGLEDLELVTTHESEYGAEYSATVEIPGMGGASMPQEISVYAIEVGAGAERSSEMLEMAREAVPRLVEQIIREEFSDRMPERNWI